MPARTHRIASLFKRFKELHGSPFYLARGVAVGVFVGIAPVMPLKTIMILTITFVLPSSVVAAFLSCTLLCNPFTYLPLYYVSWWVGNLLLPGMSSWQQLERAVARMQQSGLAEAIFIAGQMGFDTLLVILTGGCVLALPLALLSFPAAYWLFAGIQRNRQRNLT